MTIAAAGEASCDTARTIAGKPVIKAETVLEARDLTKVYRPPAGLRRVLMRSPIRQEITAVNKANLAIKQGEVFGLLGPNGAGKTTLIKMFTTLLVPSSGSATICGFDTVGRENEVRSRIGLVTGEERSFYWRLTGRHNLEFFAALYGVQPAEMRARVDEVIELMGLCGGADNMVYSYSSGMKQRLAIARALLPRPQVLFLDEPTKSVDAVVAAELKTLVREEISRAQRRTVVLATHRLEEAEELCDRIAIMDKGRILFCGTVQELRHRIGGNAEYNVTAKGLTSMQCKEVGTRYEAAFLRVERGETSGVVNLAFTPLNGDGTLSGVLRDVLSSGGTIVSCE